MDDEELEMLEEVDDPVEIESSSFPRRTLNGNRVTNVPNALKNRNLSRNTTNNSNAKKSASPSKMGKKMNNNLPQKDASAINKLKQKKKPLSFLNRGKNNNSDNSNNTNESVENTEQNNSVDGIDPIEVAVKVKRTILLIKIGLIIGGILLVVGIIVLIIYFFASILGISDTFSNLGSNNSLNNDVAYYEEAKLYHEKLNEATEMYVDSCGIYLDRSYIHAALTYGDLDSQDIESIKKMYIKMADYVDDVAKLMVSNCVVDYEINGIFYNNLKNSDFLKKYYSEQLKFMDADTLTKNIFDYAKLGIALASLNSGYISDNLKVTMGTCEQPYNKKLLNEGSNYNSTVGFSDYVMGVVMGEVEGLIKRENIEFLKAFTIVASSYALGRSGYESGDEEIWVHNGNCWQLSCDIKQGCTYCYDLGKYGTTFTGQNRSCNNLGYRKDAMNDTQRQLMNEVFKEVFGTVMLETSGKIKKPSYRDKSTTCGSNECLGQEDAALDARNGMSYKEILEKYYDNFTLSNMQEDAYAADVSYDDGGYSGSVVYYDQTDYTDKFCGQNTTIKGSGCGVTSMAMVLSTFVDKTYTPKVVMQEAYAGNYCGGSIVGTAVTFFKYSAQKHGLSYQAVSKTGDKQDVIDALKSGNSLVIAHMGPGTFTNSGHYIVLTKVNDNGEVYVLDSNNSRRTGWHDFNGVVAKQLKSYGSFHIITKR